jgi:hypothetical protein
VKRCKREVNYQMRVLDLVWSLGNVEGNVERNIERERRRGEGGRWRGERKGGSE